MTECEKPPVCIKEIPDELMQRIKKSVGLEAEPPVLILAFDREGNLSVVRSENEFNSSKDSKLIPLVNTTVATFTTTKDSSQFPEKSSTLTKANFFHNPIGGESLTDEWPDF